MESQVVNDALTFIQLTQSKLRMSDMDMDTPPDNDDYEQMLSRRIE